MKTMNDDVLLNKSESQRSPKSKLRSRCPSCGAWVNLSDAIEVWDLVNCPECSALLEVVDLRPPTLDYASSLDGDEEWDDEWVDDE